MIEEWLSHLEKYALSPHHMCSYTPYSTWVNKEVARTYLKKYFLSEKDYIKNWKPIQDAIFQNQDKTLPDMLFQDHLSLLAFRGGCLFEQRDFEALQHCAQALGDKHLIIIHKPVVYEEAPPLRMIYPSDITWEEMMSGNYISSVICEGSFDDYFVFSESGIWGKFASTDYDDKINPNIPPLDIIGFRPEYNALFAKHFKPLQKEDIEDMKNRLPPLYKDRCQWYI